MGGGCGGGGGGGGGTPISDGMSDLHKHIRESYACLV